MRFGIAGRAAAQALSALFLYAACLGPAFAHEGGHGTEAMWQACEGKQRNDICSFNNSAGDIHRGTCQSMAGHLACVRNQPIERAATSDSAAVPYDADRTFIWLFASLAIAIAGFVLFVRKKRWLRKD